MISTDVAVTDIKVTKRRGKEGEHSAGYLATRSEVEVDKGGR
eukprot:CAMPEP_0174269822 /NCGR_PEP_ID=MMETSP0439-20130205/42418_1 /TAXON_ID=0 /ORGANISM="Stereomyxa ramosa, Strain Chinc5" /LENGTH=41 /DNA_ID= /DNA_START= /DNA_END= /DNA_ORIENTATION=